MGIVMSAISRKINRFNVENRAHRILDKDKPMPAPKFEATLKDIQRSIETDPEFLQRESKKNVILDDRLKNVYVTSTRTILENKFQRKLEDDKQLPLDRNLMEDFEYGYKEPTKITPGHCSLRQAMKFITDNQHNPELWTAQKIGDEYKLKPELVVSILEYFKSFQIFVSDGTKKEKLLTQTNAKKIESSADNTSNT